MAIVPQWTDKFKFVSFLIKFSLEHIFTGDDFKQGLQLLQL